MKTLNQDQKTKLAKTCETLFTKGVASLRFIRILHNDFQILCGDDLNSPDDFYNMNREENKPMHDLLNSLGYQYSKFGICRIN